MTVLWVKTVAGIFLLVLSALFSLAETAFMSLSRVQLGRLSRAWPGRLDFWENDPDKVLVVLLLMNNLVNAGLGVLAVSMAWDAQNVGVPFYWGKFLFPFGVGTVVVLFAEVVPKSLARARAESSALFLAPLVCAMTGVFGWPMQGLLKKVESFLAWLSRTVRTEQSQWDVSVIRALLDNAPVTHPLRRVLNNVVGFAQTPVSAVMTPRTEIAAVNLSMAKDPLLSRMVNTGYSRVPVHRGALESTVGMIYSKDLLTQWRSGALIALEDLVRPLPRIRANTPLARVLRDFRKGHHHMALVTDDHEKIIGLVTIQDTLEAIVGDIAPEVRR